jgi:hypothetical protein
MAYRIISKEEGNTEAVAKMLQERLDVHSVFRARVQVVYPRGYGVQTIVLTNVRLREAKPYCGQHPGECAVGATRKGRWLEWEDWVAFHNLINDFLDAQGIVADAYTEPRERMDKGRRMYVRRMKEGRRLRYDWDDEYQATSFGGRRIQVWNHGTPDQFGGQP